jgi:hypothetical protein
LTQEEIESENFDFDSMDIDASVVKAELAARRSTRGKATRSAPEAKGSESVARLLKSVLQQTSGLSNFMSHTTRTNIEISDSLSFLVDKIANIGIQMSVLCGENEDLKNKMAILNKRIKDLGGRSSKTEHSSVILSCCQCWPSPHDPNPQLLPLPILQPTQVTKNRTLNLLKCCNHFIQELPER